MVIGGGGFRRDACLGLRRLATVRVRRGEEHNNAVVLRSGAMSGATKRVRERLAKMSRDRGRTLARDGTPQLTYPESRLAHPELDSRSKFDAKPLYAWPMCDLCQRYIAQMYVCIAG